MWIRIGGRKHCSAVLERHGWAVWQPNPEPGQREERGGVLAQLEGMCHVHCLSEITPTRPSQLNCFLIGPVGTWGHQSSFLRLDGSLPSQLIQCCVYTLYQTLGAPFCITSALVFFIHLMFQTKEPLTHVTLFPLSVMSTLLPTSRPSLLFFQIPSVI